MHILHKHGDHVAPHHLLSISIALQRGIWLADRDRCCQVIYQAHDDAPPIKVALKAVASRKEVFVTTFHVTNARQVSRYLKGGKLLRDHL